MKQKCLLAILVIVAAGCRKGPPEDTVTVRLQASLDQHFGEGILTIDELSRRGSHPFTIDGDDRDRLLTYYDATLVFGEAYDLAGWDDPNVGSLTTILGASAQGVDGVTPGGNEAGDRLEVHGAVAWLRGDDGWEEADFAPETSQREGPPDSEEPEPYRKTLAEIAEVGGRLMQEGGPIEAEVLTRELERLKTRFEAQAATLEGKLTIATASQAGSYHPLGVRLAEALEEAGIPAEAFPTTGSGENVDLLRLLYISVAIVQSDILAQARDGRGLFAAELPWRDLRALGALFPEAVQIVAADVGIGSLADLKGRRVAIGIPGSGAHVDALRVFEAGGMSWDDVETLLLPLGEAAQGLIDGSIDALVTTTAYPSSAVQRIAASRPVRLVSLDEGIVERVGALEPTMIPVQIPDGTYAGQTGPVRTVGVTAVLVTRKDTPAKQVQTIVDLVWGGEAALAGAGVAGTMVSAERREVGVTIPFHDAALP